MALLGPDVQAGRVRFFPGFIEKNKPPGIDKACGDGEVFASAFHVVTALLGGMQRLFLKVQPSLRRTVRHIVPAEQRIPNSRSQRPRNSSSVVSGFWSSIPRTRPGPSLRSDPALLILAMPFETEPNTCESPQLH